MPGRARLVSVLALGALALTCATARDADACGGVFIQEIEKTTSVTDHRMAISISRDQTVLWDQVRYTGNPAEFAWVAPAKPGTRVELSSDAWFDALEASTQPVVYAPPEYGAAAGCALTGCASDSTGTEHAGGAEVLRSDIVGPYETVTVRATDPGGITQWLQDRGFAVPDAVAPTLVAYAQEGFDFIALRLRPGCGVRAMRPVRLVIPGADPTIPLRMTAAGASAEVGLVLWVIAEARYEVQNYPSAKIDFTKLNWQRSNDRSNYDSLAKEAMGSNGGRTFITEYAQRPPLTTTVPLDEQKTVTPSLFEAYPKLCAGTSPSGTKVTQPDAASRLDPCVVVDAGAGDGGKLDASADADASTDAGFDASDDAGLEGGVADAGTSTDASADASPEAGTSDGGAPRTDAGTSIPPAATCGPPNGTDLDLALRGIPTGQAYITRLRTTLPGLGFRPLEDLRLAPVAQAKDVSNSYQAIDYSDAYKREDSPVRSALCGAPKRRASGGAQAGALFAAVVALLWLRRRSRH